MTSIAAPIINEVRKGHYEGPSPLGIGIAFRVFRESVGQLLSNAKTARAPLDLPSSRKPELWSGNVLHGYRCGQQAPNRSEGQKCAPIRQRVG